MVPAPNNPNTAAANAARRRSSEKKAADVLRERGWFCLSPDEVTKMIDAFVQNPELMRGGFSPEVADRILQLVVDAVFLGTARPPGPDRREE